MGNLEKPLTWGLVIVLLGYLFIANCDCGEESSCKANNDFNFESENGTIERIKETPTWLPLRNENIDTEGNLDTVIKIDLTEEEAIE